MFTRREKTKIGTYINYFLGFLGLVSLLFGQFIAAGFFFGIVLLRVFVFDKIQRW